MGLYNDCIPIVEQIIAIHELAQKNSGMRTGRFLEPSRIQQPGSHPDNPIYYKVDDFAMGSIISGMRITSNAIQCHAKYRILH